LKIIYTKVKFHPSEYLYKKYFPEDKEQTNLQNWARSEVQHLTSFIGMYQFWVSKNNLTTKSIYNFEFLEK